MIMVPECQEALVVLDSRRRVRRVSAQAAALLGRSVKELVGLIWDDIEHPEILHLSTRTQTLEGKNRRDTLHLITLVHNEAEGPQDHLVEPWSESTELVLVCSMDGRVLAVNSAFGRKFGVQASHWEGWDPAALLHPEDVESWRATIAKLERPPYRVSHEHRWQTAQGWRWLSWEELVLRDDNGTVYARRAVGRDVTRRRLAEEHFHKLASIVEQSPLSVVLTMPDGRVEYVNPRYSQVSGYTLEEIFEGRIELLRSGFTSEDSYVDFLQTVRSGAMWRGELCARTKSGRDVWEAVQVSSIRDQNDAITHLLCLREDITERKLLEDKLRQAQKMEILGTLAGGISHDFNNLLAIIKGFCEIGLMKCEPDGVLPRYFGEIHDAANRAAGLVRQILTFSRKQEESMRPVDVNQLVDDLGRMVGETFPRSIRFVFELDPCLPVLKGDHNKLQQVIMNLCVNARDAMPDGGSMRICTRVQDGAGIARLGADAATSYACIEVEDTGQGMGPEVQARIFEPFFTTKEKNSGTGLGLAVVYGIVTGHGGLLDVKSAVGEGTTFSVYLPLPAADEKTGVADRGRASTSAEIPPGKETLLVVEDEPGMRRLFSTAFSEAGYQVSCVANGAEAVEFLLNRSEALDAVLLDLNLPEVGGLQVRNLIARTRPSTRIIIVSGHVSHEMRQELEKDSELIVVGKPCNLGELGKLLRKQLDRTASRLEAVNP